MMAWLRRLGYWRRGRSAAAELEDELQFHREMAEHDLLQRGESAPDAARLARRSMGNTLLAREDARAVWVAPWLDGLWQDVRHGVRSLRRSPGLVIVSALSLGLGIGLNAMLYMGISTIFWHRPTMADPARTVGVEPGSTNQFSHPDYQDLLASRIFDDAAGFRIESLNSGSGARVFRVGVLAVTANFFRVLGVEARQGRTFSPADAAPEREPREAVVTTEYWRTSLGADPAAVGSALVLNGERFTVVGVLPDGYKSVVGWVGPQVYVPLSRLTVQALNERRTPSLSVIARLKSSATARQAETAVTALMTSLERAYPDRLSAAGRTASVFPAVDAQFRGVQRRFQQFATLSLLMAGLVLLIACVNVSGLLMARATERRREIAVRLAVGAGRARVVQAMLVESGLLVTAGAVMGLVLTFVLNQISFPASMAWIQDVTAVDTDLLPYAVMLVLATTLVCGVVPALRATRGDVASEVRQSGETVTPRLWWRQTLVIAQVAMSLVLIVASLLCVRSQLQIARVDLGFDIDHGVVARLALDASQYPGEARVPFADRVVERIGQIPGVSSVSLANVIPLGGDSLIRSFHPAGRTDIPGTRASTYSVGPSFFRTLAIPLLKGREFDASHRRGAPVVAIVNETFARTYFPGRDVIGQHVQTEDEPEAEVIGLVRDHRIGTIGEAPQSVVYYPFAQRPRSLMVHARTTASPEALVTEVQRVMDDIDATIPLSVQTLRGATSLELTMRRVGTMLMGTLGAVGLLLAMIGLYGVMSYVAASRTAEVGIRMALGASRPRIRWEMLQRASIMVARGVALGALASVAVTPVFSTFLAGTSPFDPIAFGGAALLLIVIGLAASYIPAVRSSRLDAMRALRRQ